MLVARFHIDVHTCLTRVHVPQRHNDTLRSAEHWISRNTTERLQKHFDKFDVATSRGQMKRLEMASHSQLYSTIFNYIRLYSTIFNYIQLYSTIFNYIQLYSTIFDYIQLYSTLSLCMFMPTYDNLCQFL